MEKTMSDILKYCEYSHLPINLEEVSKPFHDLIHKMDEYLDDCAEKSAGLRKILEAEDCCIRAALKS
jgi:hypothetical protein